jgi:hypothetical protein
MMHAREKSDSAIVAEKPTNKAVSTAAESVERRAGTKGNANQQSMDRAQNRATVSQALERIRRVAHHAVRRHTPKVGAVCGNSARTDLSGGRSAMAVPTALLTGAPSASPRAVRPGQGQPVVTSTLSSRRPAQPPRGNQARGDLIENYALGRSSGGIRMIGLPRRLPLATSILLWLLLDIAFARSASAHVKWFCAYDVAERPEGLEKVLCPSFGYLIGLSALALFAGALFEATPVGPFMLRAFDWVTSFARNHIETIFRASVAFFFIAIWGFGGILLTPELKTNSNLIGAIQLGIAAGMLSRVTMPLSAAGIFALYAVAIRNYGIFHLADYPVFLGIALYLALTGLQRNLFGWRPIDVLRWAAGITLMWASIEKWAYPEWSYPLLAVHPEMTFGYTPEFYMRAAGVVEFALAFALLWTPLVRRVAAAMLIELFVSAVFEFGKVDLIGHTLIVVALLGILADDGGTPVRPQRAWLLPVSYASALIAFLALYYVGHAELFGTSIL